MCEASACPLTVNIQCLQTTPSSELCTEVHETPTRCSRAQHDKVTSVICSRVRCGTKHMCALTYDIEGMTYAA